MKKEILAGSRWWAGVDKKFVVLSVVDTDDGHTWVHYRDDDVKADSKEYSCYIESFLSRYSPRPE
jgi:hypothetical protein